MSKKLPDVSNIERLELFGEDYNPTATIENVEGQSLSLQIYYQLALDFGGIGPKAANSGLLMYGNHADDARANPGKHPNIDRLIDVLNNDFYLSVKAVPKRSNQAG
ncbi:MULTISPECIES: DUF2322 family protein [Thioalkalivibrio]|uniref:DUF2322 family protein n=1 Tax=Thioalkalivibrio TaxID=106633 RepID=UPI000364FAA9|nr:MULTISPECIES: DUF2322 family protein [Thioalkalivibrio]OOC48564.1 hypothetical protein B0684_08710 [Thioalkalivibrio versutus]